MIPPAFIAALGAYRVSGRQMRIVLVLATEAWPYPRVEDPRDVVMPYQELARRINIPYMLERRGLYDDMRALRQHRLVYKVPYRTDTRVWRLNTDWVTWNWWEEADLSLVGAVVDEVANEGGGLPNPEATAAARMLWYHVRRRDGREGQPCYRQIHDPVWQRWTQAMAGLLERGYTLRDVRDALRQTEPWLDKLLVGRGAAGRFVQYFPALLLRARRAMLTAETPP